MTREYLLRAVLALLMLLTMTGCDKLVKTVKALRQQAANTRTWVEDRVREAAIKKSRLQSATPERHEGAKENIDAEEQAQAALLKPAKDPVAEEINNFFNETHQLFSNSRFDELEKRAADLRATKQRFGNGSWKIRQFYESLTCRSTLEADWQACEGLLKNWITAKPESSTAHVAYAHFLTGYAWQARGSGYADTVSEQGWELFHKRLQEAAQQLKASRELSENDLFWWSVAMRIALGQSWPRLLYDELVNKAHAFEPQYWGYDTARAYSLLPRWHGKPGDWEAYAAETSARPDGPGAEVYARIVIYLADYHQNIFTQSQASWPKTREGLALMRERYPGSLDAISYTALLAAYAEDQELAKEMFELLGDNYLPHVWHNPQRFTHCRKWARTGQW